MLEQRLQQRPRLLLIPPALLVLLIALSAIIFAQSPGAQPREAIFDLFSRTAPRGAAPQPSVVIVDIDAESLTARGPWPWPRSALAQLVTSAKEAGAQGVVVTVPVEGTDPLSPDTIGGFFTADPASAPALEALSALPTTNAALIQAASTMPTALGLGQTPAALTEWDRADLSEAEWLTAGPNGTTDYIALPAAPIFSEIETAFGEIAALAVASLPTDKDGKVRRTPVLWSLDQQPTPSAAFAPFILGEGTAHAQIAGRQLRAGGPPPARLDYADRQTVPLDPRAGLRLWLPSELDLPTIPAWRVLQGDGTWTGPMEGKIVFIGESVSPLSVVETSRGPLPITAVHAHLTEQLALGIAPVRPGWAGVLEALLAILAGATGIAAAMFMRPAFPVVLSATITFVTSLTFFALFGRTGILLDPTPVVMAAIGGPLTILGVVIGNMLMRDDALRGAFHGALPPQTMMRLQTSGGAKLLHGVRRDVTVLSCRLRVPAQTADRFRERPDDYVRFTAAANDTLRRAILAHDGTVDYGEDGRLLGYWNVPEATSHAAEKACACSLKMIDEINSLSEDLQTAAIARGSSRGLDASFADTSVEIGLASSMCFAGPVGRGNRNRYAVIGEAVGIASALRKRSSVYGPTIITDDIIFDALRHHYAFLDLDVLRLPPETETPRMIYGLVGNPFLKASKAFRQLADVQRELVLNWRTGDYTKATAQLQRLRGMPGVPESYINMFEARLSKARGVDKDTGQLVETIIL